MCSILPRTVAWLSNCWEPELLQRECSHSLGMPNQRKLGGPPLRFIPEEPNFFWAPILKSQELVPQLRRQTCVTNRFLVWLPNHSICCCLGGGGSQGPHYGGSRSSFDFSHLSTISVQDNMREDKMYCFKKKNQSVSSHWRGKKVNSGLRGTTLFTYYIIMMWWEVC